MVLGNMTVTRWWWVRHAPVTGLGGELHGSDDVDCDCSDEAALEILSRALPREAVWITSRLKRTRRTAEAIQAAGNLRIRPTAVEDLDELSFGRWQGRTWAEIEEKFAEEFKTFWENPTRNAARGGESFEAQMRRCAAAIQALNASHGGRDIVSISHGGTIRAALAQALNLASEDAMAIVVDNLSLTRIDHLSVPSPSGGGESWRVLAVNLPVNGVGGVG